MPLFKKYLSWIDLNVDVVILKTLMVFVTDHTLIKIRIEENEFIFHAGTKIINKKLSLNKRDFWLQKLVDADVPAAPILSIDEVIHSEHVISQNQIDFIEVELSLIHI